MGGFALDKRIEVGQSLLVSRLEHLEMSVNEGFKAANGRIDATNSRIDSILALQPAVAPPLSPLAAQPIVTK